MNDSARRPRKSEPSVLRRLLLWRLLGGWDAAEEARRGGSMASSASGSAVGWGSAASPSRLAVRLRPSSRLACAVCCCWRCAATARLRSSSASRSSLRARLTSSGSRRQHENVVAHPSMTVWGRMVWMASCARCRPRTSGHLSRWSTLAEGCAEYVIKYTRRCTARCLWRFANLCVFGLFGCRAEAAALPENTSRKRLFASFLSSPRPAHRYATMVVRGGGLGRCCFGSTAHNR